MYPKMSTQIQCADDTQVIVASASADLELFFINGEQINVFVVDRIAATKLWRAILRWWIFAQWCGLRPWLAARQAKKWKATNEDRRASL